MKSSYVLIAFVVAVATGCSKTSDYTPASGVSGAEIFEAACVECHKDAAPKIFQLKADNATPASIKKSIAEGNMMMPKFPNIQGESLDALVEYVLANSEKK